MPVGRLYGGSVKDAAEFLANEGMLDWRVVVTVPNVMLESLVPIVGVRHGSVKLIPTSNTRRF